MEGRVIDHSQLQHDLETAYSNLQAAARKRKRYIRKLGDLDGDSSQQWSGGVGAYDPFRLVPLKQAPSHNGDGVVNREENEKTMAAVAVEGKDRRVFPPFKVLVQPSALVSNWGEGGGDNVAFFGREDLKLRVI